MSVHNFVFVSVNWCGLRVQHVSHSTGTIFVSNIVMAFTGASSFLALIYVYMTDEDEFMLVVSTVKC